MSRFGKLPVTIPQGVTVTLENGVLKVAGKKGTIERNVPDGVNVVMTDGVAQIEVKNDSKILRANQGTVRAHLLNMIKGVTEGWVRTLEIVGAGFRAEVRGQDLVMQIGFSHPVVITAPSTVSFKVEKSIVTVEGANKEEVGHIASLVRGSRPPEPYKGTGIKYTDEIIRRKAGKQAAK